MPNKFWTKILKKKKKKKKRPNINPKKNAQQAQPKHILIKKKKKIEVPNGSRHLQAQHHFGGRC